MWKISLEVCAEPENSNTVKQCVDPFPTVCSCLWSTFTRREGPGWLRLQSWRLSGSGRRRWNRTESHGTFELKVPRTIWVVGVNLLSSFSRAAPDDTVHSSPNRLLLQTPTSPLQNQIQSRKVARSTGAEREYAMTCWPVSHWKRLGKRSFAWPGFFPSTNQDFYHSFATNGVDSEWERGLGQWFRKDGCSQQTETTLACIVEIFCEWFIGPQVEWCWIDSLVGVTRRWLFWMGIYSV